MDPFEDYTDKDFRREASGGLLIMILAVIAVGVMFLFAI